MKSIKYFASLLLALASANAAAVMIEIRFDVAGAMPAPAPTVTYSAVAGGDLVSVDVGCLVNGTSCVVDSDDFEGLGVVTPNDSSEQVDGAEGAEGLSFMFNTAVELIRIDFDKIGGTNDPTDPAAFNTLSMFLPAFGDINLGFVDFGGPIATANCDPSVDDGAPQDECELTFSPSVTTDYFELAAINSFSDFRVESIYLNTIPVTAVAEPSMLALVGFGLVLLGLRRKN